MNGAEEDVKMRRKISWFLLLLAGYLILLISNSKNLKYFPNLIRELGKLIKRNSKYTEDSDFILIPKIQIKEL